MADGLIEKATRNVVGIAGTAAVGAVALEAAGFSGNSLYYFGTEPTSGSQTMLAHIGVGMAAYNPMGEENPFWNTVGDNALTGLYIGGAIAAYVAGKKLIRMFSPSQG